MAKKSEKKKIDWDYDSNHLFVQKLYRKHPFKLLRKISTAIASSFVFILMGLYIAALVLVPIAMIRFNWHWAVIFVVVALTIISIVPLRALAKRRKFFKTLKKYYGKNQKVKISVLTKPYSTLFTPSGVCDVKIETPDTIYLIMFFPTANGSQQLMFAPDGRSAVKYSPVFLGKLGRLIGFKPYGSKQLMIVPDGRPAVKYSPGFLGKLGRLIGFKPSRKKTNIEFNAETDEFSNYKKILLLNPVPKEMAVCGENGDNIRQSGPGERFPGFTVENTASLIRMIESDLDKKFY